MRVWTDEVLYPIAQDCEATGELHILKLARPSLTIYRQAYPTASYRRYVPARYSAHEDWTRKAHAWCGFNEWNYDGRRL